jgi:hypothetical protein
MTEYQILVRLNKTIIIKDNTNKFYGNCQVCSDKNGEHCIEASQYPSCKTHIVFIFCKDCHSALNEICSVFIYKKNNYVYEDSYHINENPILKKRRWIYNKYYINPIWRT